MKSGKVGGKAVHFILLFCPADMRMRHGKAKSLVGVKKKNQKLPIGAQTAKIFLFPVRL